MSSAKREDYRHVYPAPSVNGSVPRLPSSDVFAPSQHYSQQDASTQSLPTHVADNREWCTPAYRPARGYSDSRRFHPYTMPARAQSSSPPHPGTRHHPQHPMHPTVTSPYGEYQGFNSARSLPSMPELTPAAVRPDNVASSGPLPFDKEQILAQSSSRSSFLTPPNSAPPCANGPMDEQHTPTSSHANVLSHASSSHLEGSAAGSSAASHQQAQGQYRGAAAQYGLDANSDNDSGHGDSPYTTVLRQSQSQLHENSDSPDDGASADGDLEDNDATAEFRTGSGKKLKLSDEFARVPGRLSLLGAASKYVVTVGEIKRRLSPPECLNASLLGGVLRKAKAKNGGSDLRKALDDIGVALPPGRRKATSTSMLTSLVEEESKALANQFNEVCATMFPVAEMANTVSQQHEYHQRGNMYRDHRQNDIHAALSLTNELRELMDVYINMEEQNENKDNDRLPMTGLRQFSLITHSFGVPTISGVLTLFQNYLTALLKCTGGIPVRDDHALHRGQIR